MLCDELPEGNGEFRALRNAQFLLRRVQLVVLFVREMRGLQEHATLSNILFVYVALRIGGVVFTSIRHRENLLGSMLHGRKRE